MLTFIKDIFNVRVTNNSYKIYIFSESLALTRDVKRASLSNFEMVLTGRGLKKPKFFRIKNIVTLILILSGFGLNRSKRTTSKTNQITNLKVKF